MAHNAVLRHDFDIRRNPKRLGPPSEETFWLPLGHGGESPTWLVGSVLWLISWEGFMKTRHILNGWFEVSRVGKRPGVVAQHFACGNEGAVYVPGLGPIEQRPWFQKFVESNRRFRDGEPTDVEEHLGELLTLARSAGQRVPTTPEWDQVAHGPASFDL
jgi:hypothetical protein